MLDRLPDTSCRSRPAPRASSQPLIRRLGVHRGSHLMGRQNASVRDGGRRQRSSPTPGCNGQDMVKVRQGKPVKKEVNGRREEGR
jgi:hypothetical protein